MKTTALFLLLLSCFCGNAQTPLVFLDYPLDPPGVIQNDDPKNFFIFNGRMYFSASDYNHGDELWSTDGTPLGTIKVKEINDNGTTAGSSPAGFTEVTESLFFQRLTPTDESFGYQTAQQQVHICLKTSFRVHLTQNPTILLNWAIR